MLKCLYNVTHTLPHKISDQSGPSLDGPILFESSVFLTLDSLAHASRYKAEEKDTCNKSLCHTELCKVHRISKVSLGGLNLRVASLQTGGLGVEDPTHSK